jgi:hypothetical protein
MSFTKTPRRAHHRNHKAAVPHGSINSDNVASQHPGALNVVADMIDLFKKTLRPERARDLENRVGAIMERVDRLPDQDRIIAQQLFERAADRIIDADLDAKFGRTNLQPAVGGLTAAPLPGKAAVRP